jgi:DNA topoisomerase-1
MPNVKHNDLFINKQVIKHDKETQPPKRFTPASIIRELEKLDLGTKSTRSNIIESLYQRNYVKNESIEATDLGIQTVETLEKYIPEILDVKLTRHFEKEMEKIRQKKLSEDTVLKEAELTLTKILDKFKSKEKSIGVELSSSHKQSMEKDSYIGKCPNCGNGNIKIMYSRKSKRKFIACDNYPKCKTIMNMPGYGKVTATAKTCEHCKFPIVKIIAGRNTRETCINTDCPSKKSDDKEAMKQIAGMQAGHIEKICPKCGKALIVRTSVYGQFIGCTGFPKCRYIEKIPKNDEEKIAVEQKRAYYENQANNPKQEAKTEIKKSTVRKKVSKKKLVKKPSIVKS